MKRWVLRHERTDYEKERESALQEWEELMTVVEWRVSGANDLRFLGREFHKRVSGERSCGKIDQQT